jgi:hypothetical protein
MIERRWQGLACLVTPLMESDAGSERSGNPDRRESFRHKEVDFMKDGSYRAPRVLRGVPKASDETNEMMS